MEIPPKIKSLKLWLLLAIIFNRLLFWAIIPMWHGPDEQAHFAQIQYLAEHKQSFPSGKNFTTSEEVVVSERLLGTERNEFGKNKFTHHPDFKIPYTQSLIGDEETRINNLPLSTRTNLVKTEATHYPPLFYVLSALFYLIVNPLGLITRVFVTRLASVLMGIGLSFIVFQLSQLLYPKNSLKAYTLTIMVSFQPMLSFLTTTVNSDNLMNLLFTLFLYLCCRSIVEQKFPPSRLVILNAVIIAGFFTKPHFAIALPILFLLPFFIKIERRKLSAFLLLALVLSVLRLNKQIIDVIRGQGLAFSDIGLRFLSNPQTDISLPTHIMWTIRHTVAEVIPWYWGVFNWLGVTLPRNVNRVINRLLIISTVGIVIWAWKHRPPKKFLPQDKARIFLGLSAGIFFVVLLLWDWLYIRGKSFSFGMQGRYYFPVISAHMAWILTGILSLVPTTWSKVEAIFIKLLGLSMMVLNTIGLYTIVKAYYHLNLSVFILEVSQYKPVFIKYPWFLIWVGLYAISIATFVYKYFKYAQSHSRSRH